MRADLRINERVLREIESEATSAGIQPREFGDESLGRNTGMLAGGCDRTALMDQQPPRVPGLSPVCSAIALDITLATIAIHSIGKPRLNAA